jgi:hypothetical protein
MILLEIIKLRLAMPSTARFFAGAGILIACVGVMLFLFWRPAPDLMVLNCAGLVTWRLAQWRLKQIGKNGRIGR